MGKPPGHTLHAWLELEATAASPLRVKEAVLGVAGDSRYVRADAGLAAVEGVVDTAVDAAGMEAVEPGMLVVEVEEDAGPEVAVAELVEVCRLAVVEDVAAAVWLVEGAGGTSPDSAAIVAAAVQTLEAVLVRRSKSLLPDPLGEKKSLD